MPQSSSSPDIAATRSAKVETAMKARLARRGVVAISVVTALLLLVIGASTWRWVGTTFPGFFVLANGVVPSISLPNWDPASLRTFQHQVAAVDGTRVASAAEVYDHVRRKPAGSSIRYRLRAPDGALTTEVVRSRQFSLTDYTLLFGAYLFCAVAFIGTGLLVFWARPHSAAGVGLLCACLGLGLYALTGADLYGPHWFFRLHVIAETMFPAGVIHLALVFPTDRIQRHRGSVLLAVYLPFGLLALLYQCVLYWPSAYTTIHLAASTAQGLSGVILLVAVMYDRFTTHSPLARWQSGIVASGAITAFLAPTILTATSGVLDGSIAVNGAAFTAFIFPLCLGYAVMRRDFFDSFTFRGGAMNDMAQWTASRAAGVSSWLSQSTETPRRILRRLDERTHGGLVRGTAGAAGTLALGLAAVTAVNSIGWIGADFPGFFVMRNRVIPSISLPSWETDGSALFQHQILAVDGTPVSNAAEIYDRVREYRVGTPVEYTVRGPDGVVTTESMPSRRFSQADYASLFGPFLLTGLSFLLAGLCVFLLRPQSPAGLGFLSIGLSGGLFVVTAVDLYGPHWFFRLHVMAEALVPASLIHLALVFPSNRLRRGYRPFLVAVYALCLVVGISYEVALSWPTAYSAVHLLASALQGVAGLMMIWIVTFDLFTTTSALVRRRVLVAGLGAIAAFVLPSVLMAASGVRDGSVPVNSAALTGFLFPLCLAYAIAKRDLLKVDVFVYQAAVILIAIVSSTYVATLSAVVSVKSRFL